jgi:flavodoxin
VKTLVVYDSLYGNTKTIAQAIGETISGEVEVLHVGDAVASSLGAYDLVVVGAPTHGFRPSPPMRDFLKRIPRGALQGVKVAAFDTRATEEELHAHGVILSTLVNVFGYAAEPISDRLEKKGGELVISPEGFYVDGTEGPLTEGELERAADWARQILAKQQCEPLDAFGQEGI